MQFPQHTCHAGFVLALGWAATVRQLSLIQRSTVAASAQRGIRSGNLTMNPSRFGIFTLGSVSAFITSLRIGNSKHLFPHARLYPRPGMRSIARVSGENFSARDALRALNRLTPTHFDGFARARAEPGSSAPLQNRSCLGYQAAGKSASARAGERGGARAMFPVG